MDFLLSLCIILFSAIWDIPYRKMGIGDFHKAGEMDKVAWYRFMQHGGIALFALNVWQVSSWDVVAIAYLISWSGLQDAIWHLFLWIPMPEKFYLKNWTPL